MIGNKLFAFAVALSCTVSSTAFSYDLDDVQRASGSNPTTKLYVKPQNIFEYDLKVQNLCDNAGSLNNVATAWVGTKRGNYNIFTQDGFDSVTTITDRSVALAAVVTFPNAKGDQVKQVKVPIIAKTNFGDITVQNCDGTIVTDVPANARVKLHFEFRRSATVRFNDPTKLVRAFSRLVESGIPREVAP